VPIRRPRQRAEVQVTFRLYTKDTRLNSQRKEQHAQRISLLADSFEYLSSRHCNEGIRGVHSGRDLHWIVCKVLKFLAEAVH
jgi:hypothetical protein